MAEANLVKGDLLEILAKISPRLMEDKWRHKLAVATCMGHIGFGRHTANGPQWSFSCL